MNQGCTIFIFKASYTVAYNFTEALDEDTTLYGKFYDMIPISNAEDLKNIANNPSARYYLTQDISLGGTVWTPIADFKGEFDGSGHRIKDFIISSSASLVGFFTTNSGTVKNLTFSDFSFTVTSTSAIFIAGPLAGCNKGTVENCHVSDAVITYDYYRAATSETYQCFAGGLIGSNEGRITNCTVTADISSQCKLHVKATSGNSNTATTAIARLRVGGAVGNNGTGATIEKVVANTAIKATAITSDERCNAYGAGASYPYACVWVGGAVAYNRGSVENCNSHASVTGFSASSTVTYGEARPEIWFGGFVSSNEGSVSKCYASGSFEDKSTAYNIRAGGFAHFNGNGGQIKDCYTDVEIISAQQSTSSDRNLLGGFVAENVGGTIASSYAEGNIRSASLGACGGFVGHNTSGSVISKCFTASTVTYSTSAASVGCFVGIADEGGTLFKNYYGDIVKIMHGDTNVTSEDASATSTTVASLQNESLLVDTLGWSADVWSFKAGEYPTLIK